MLFEENVKHHLGSARRWILDKLQRREYYHSMEVQMVLRLLYRLELLEASFNVQCWVLGSLMMMG